MNMRKQGKSKSSPNPANKQEKLSNLEITNKIMESGITQPHNAKKEGLGPNTRRGG